MGGVPTCLVWPGPVLAIAGIWSERKVCLSLRLFIYIHFKGKEVEFEIEVPSRTCPLRACLIP